MGLFGDKAGGGGGHKSRQHRVTSGGLFDGHCRTHPDNKCDCGKSRPILGGDEGLNVQPLDRTDWQQHHTLRRQQSQDDAAVLPTKSTTMDTKVGRRYTADAEFDTNGCNRRGTSRSVSLSNDTGRRYDHLSSDNGKRYADYLKDHVKRYVDYLKDQGMKESPSILRGLVASALEKHPTMSCRDMFRKLNR